MKTTKTKKTCNSKINNIARKIEMGQDEFLTTNQSIRIKDDKNTLKNVDRGATSLLNDLQLRAKITNIDHEGIPEHNGLARGSISRGYFELNTPMSINTKAKNQQTPGYRTHAVSFGTVAGSHGSTGLARELRGFIVNFYTEEGNNGLAGNNIPVFFIQDAGNEIPLAASGTDVQLRRTRQPEKTAPYYASLASQESSLMTKRESQVAELIAEGLTNKEIGNTLHLSHLTVKSHVHNILAKMALSTRLQIAKYFYASK